MYSGGEKHQRGVAIIVKGKLAKSVINYQEISETINKNYRKAKEQFYDEKCKEIKLLDKAHNLIIYKKSKNLNKSLKQSQAASKIKAKNS